MRLNYFAFAIPLFLLLMLAEMLGARKRPQSYFHHPETIANISVGIAERLCDLFVAGLFYQLYDHLQKRYGLFHIRSTFGYWIILLVATDFLWYWYHRLAHELNILWAVHVVHHQSSDFNFTVSARITLLQALVRAGFWCLLPVAGFSADMITGILILHGLYPFFVHTRLVGKLGPLEYFMVTPSHHRVHHASNPCYLDKNYGDMFIIWDKLFGTFCEEDKNVDIVYGLTEPLGSYSFLWQHFHFVIELYHGVCQRKGWKNKLRLFVESPKSLEPGIRAGAERFFRIKKYDRQTPPKLNRYVVWQIAITLIILFLFILFSYNIPVLYHWAISALILITLVNCGAILEQKAWIVYLEAIRLLVLVLLLAVLSAAVWVVLLLIIAASLVPLYFRYLSWLYLGWVYRTSPA